MLWAELAAQQVAGGGADGNGEIKNAENAAAFFFGEQVGNESRRDGNERGFAHTDEGMANQQLPVGMGDRRQQRQSAPEEGAENDDQLARIAVGQRPGERRRDHVEAQKSASQIAHLSIAEMKLGLHQRLHREQHGTVNVIQQVERGKQTERRPGIEFRRGHLAKEYNMIEE